MRAALVLLSLGSVAAFGGAKVIAGCMDTRATNYNTPGPVTLSVPDMCQFNPAPPAPPSAPGRYGRGKGECCGNNYNCKSGRCTSSSTRGFSRGAFDERCLGQFVWANPAGLNSSDGSQIMWPTCWAEATPDQLVEQLQKCEEWDARPQTKGTPCPAQVEGLGKCDEGRQNGNSCFGAIGEYCEDSKDCAQEDVDASWWFEGNDWGAPDKPIPLKCGRVRNAKSGVVQSWDDIRNDAFEDVRCAARNFKATCSLSETDTVDCGPLSGLPAVFQPQDYTNQNTAGQCITACEALSSCRCIPM